MAVVRRKTEEPGAGADKAYAELVRTVTEFVQVDRDVKTMSARQGLLKKRLSATVEELGEEDDKGHIWLELQPPVAGLKGLQRQRRVSQGLDEDRADAILKERGLGETCYRTVRVLDEEAVMAAFYEDKLTEAEVDAMFPKKISYAFLPLRDE